MEESKGITILLVVLLALNNVGCSCSGKNSNNNNKQMVALNKLQRAKRIMKKLGGESGMETGHFKVPILGPDQGHRILPQSSTKAEDKIQRLPGQPNDDVQFNQYGGYITVSTLHHRALYYYFVEAPAPPAADNNQSLPLLLWLNGGPGCSSLAYGAMQELGPFRVNSDGKTLFKNEFSWNRAANVLFLESPAGVGFSYSNTTSDYKKSGDRSTAKDNYVFLLNWLERFPEYKNREFYISGESYAGHYVPQLAYTILLHNKKFNKTIINLKGIIIGNAVINDETDERGMYDYFGSHALISDETLEGINKYCDFSPLRAPLKQPKCDNLVNDVFEDIGDIDIYNIYAPQCTNSSLTTHPKSTTNSAIIDPCSEYYVKAYLNRPDVQEAMHANITKLDHDWEACSDVVDKWNDSPSTIIPLLRYFMANGIRLWIFSGDTDGRVPVTSTKYSINSMNLPIKTSWYPWFLDDEVGGYTQVYEGNLTFATVRGAGHQVPSYQPNRALSLVTYFLSGKPLPRATT